jgi:hypothetical protein
MPVMDEGHTTEETRAGQTHPPPMPHEQFRASPEFRRFRNGMTKLLRMTKTQLDARVEQAKADSPRLADPNAPGRKKRNG